MTAESKSINMHLRTLLGHLSAAEKADVEKALCASASKGWLWSKAAYLYFSKFTSNSSAEAFVKVTTHVENSKVDTVPLLHAIQSFSSGLTYEHVCNVLTPLGKIVALRSLMHCDEIEVQIAEIFSVIEDIEKQSRIHFLYERYVHFYHFHRHTVYCILNISAANIQVAIVGTFLVIRGTVVTIN